MGLKISPSGREMNVRKKTLFVLGCELLKGGSHDQVLIFLASVCRIRDAESIFRESGGGGKGVERARERRQ